MSTQIFKGLRQCGLINARLPLGNRGVFLKTCLEKSLKPVELMIIKTLVHEPRANARLPFLLCHSRSIAKHIRCGTPRDRDASRRSADGIPRLYRILWLARSL